MTKEKVQLPPPPIYIMNHINHVYNKIINMRYYFVNYF